MKIDSTNIRELAEILNDTGLTEIEVEGKDMKIRVTREVTVTQVAAPVAMAAAPVLSPTTAVAALAEETPAATDASHPGALTSPMVGTAYMAPEPGAADFVSVGDKVSVGDTIMIIEAMKVMNPIKATKAGTVTKIVAIDTSPVEFGDVLAIIE
ncbi:MAG: acetyl-CoA carboxylase, biotin carboxyl carrier protein [Alphaproteobacteria bacterium]|nr:MAG: acetyl-CoA carboxylase, biotin carboxyl carrier protein [Alphaproteobacteria bacterium]